MPTVPFSPRIFSYEGPTHFNPRGNLLSTTGEPTFGAHRSVSPINVSISRDDLFRSEDEYVPRNDRTNIKNGGRFVSPDNIFYEDAIDSNPMGNPFSTMAGRIQYSKCSCQIFFSQRCNWIWSHIKINRLSI